MQRRFASRVTPSPRLAPPPGRLLTRHLHWRSADAWCSLGVALCILAAALPLLRDAALLLLLRTPPLLRGGGERACIARIAALPHVRGVRSSRFWSHTGARAFGVVAVNVADGASEGHVARGVEQVAREYGVQTVTVEVLKEDEAEGAPLFLRAEPCTYE